MKMRRKACEAGEKWGRDDENKDRGEAREPVGGRREWDMSQAYSINTHLPHPCLIVLFIHCTHYKMVGNVWRHLVNDTPKHTFTTQVLQGIS